MEKFAGKGHLPGTEKQSDIELEIDWEAKEVSVRIEGVAAAMEN